MQLTQMGECFQAQPHGRLFHALNRRRLKVPFLSESAVSAPQRLLLLSSPPLRHRSS